MPGKRHEDPYERIGSIRLSKEREEDRESSREKVQDLENELKNNLDQRVIKILSISCKHNVLSKFLFLWSFIIQKTFYF